MEVLAVNLLLFPFKMDLLHDLIKQIFSHQKVTIFRFDSQNFDAEVQHLFNIFAACIQIVHFFAFFDCFRDLSCNLQLTLLEYRLLGSLPLFSEYFALWIHIVSSCPCYFSILKLLKQLCSQLHHFCIGDLFVLFLRIINAGARKGWVITLNSKAKEFYLARSKWSFSLFDETMLHLEHCFEVFG